MDAGPRAVLRAALRIGIPDAVEEDDHGANSVVAGDMEEALDVFEEGFAIVVPGEVVEEDANRVEAERLGPAELAVDGFGIERLGLEHFELVDGGAGDEVAADEPGLSVVPIIRLLRGPALGGVG